MNDSKASTEPPELPDDLPDLPNDALTVTAPPAAPGEEAGERPPLRKLDRAPLHLRKAAVIVAAGALLPFMGNTTDGWLLSLGAKALAFLAAWIWYLQVLHDFGTPASGLLGQLASLHLAPKKKAEEKPKRRASARTQDKGPSKLVHPFPTGLHLLSLALLGMALLVAARDPRSSVFGPLGVAELGMFSWAVFTWVHIAAYERWSGFNPLFPLMFLAMLFAGIARVLAATGDLEPLARIASGLGGAAVAAGGGLAAWTIVEAMRQAKVEGDRKKQEAAAARRAARQARRGAS